MARDVFFLGDHMRLSIEAFGGQLVTARIPALQARHFALGTDVAFECSISECRLLEE
jgi:putative spermidine/putrescine transport system ATP-binding protein